MNRAPLLLVLVLAGCCSSTELSLEAFDPRLELPTLATFALVCPVLDDPRAWAYAEPPAALRAHEARYRPEPTKRPSGFVAPFPDPRTLRPSDGAPPDLKTLLRTARTELIALGYRPTTGKAADFVVCMAATRRADGGLDRISLQLGAIAGGRFEPFQLSIAATVPEEDPCPIELQAVIAELLRALPPRSTAP